MFREKSNSSNRDRPNDRNSLVVVLGSVVTSGRTEV